MLEKDPIVAYENKLRDSAWLKANNGRCVVFVGDQHEFSSIGNSTAEEASSYFNKFSTNKDFTLIVSSASKSDLGLRLPKPIIFLLDKLDLI